MLLFPCDARSRAHFRAADTWYCDECYKVNPPVRYKCRRRSDYDLCEDCHRKDRHGDYARHSVVELKDGHDALKAHLREHRIVILGVFSGGCPPSRVFQAHFEKFATHSTYLDKMLFLIVRSAGDRRYASLRISSVPRVVCYLDEQVVSDLTIEGLGQFESPTAQLEEVANQLLKVSSKSMSRAAQEARAAERKEKERAATERAARLVVETSAAEKRSESQAERQAAADERSRWVAERREEEIRLQAEARVAKVEAERARAAAEEEARAVAATAAEAAQAETEAGRKAVEGKAALKAAASAENALAQAQAAEEEAARRIAEATAAGEAVKEAEAEREVIHRGPGGEHDAKRQRRPAQSDSTPRRRALVIGVSQYESLKKLNEALNDAEQVADTLEKPPISFDHVTRVVDDGRIANLREQTKKFNDSLGPNDTALFYFAGHGIDAQSGRADVTLLAQESPRTDEGRDGYAKYSIKLEDLEVMFTERRERATTIFILDCCREAPPSKCAVALRGPSVFDPVDQQRPEPTDADGECDGIIIAYACARGARAVGFTQTGGLFTEHLLAQIQNVSMPLVNILCRVRADVCKAIKSLNANRRMDDQIDDQKPWLYISHSNSSGVFLNPKAAGALSRER